MGYNTVAVLYNDFSGEFRNQGEHYGPRIAAAMRDYHDKDRSRRNFGAGVVVSQDHADGEQVVIVHANYGCRADEATGLGWMALQQMAACLERHGYKVTKSERKRKVPPIRLTEAEAEFVADMRLEEAADPERWSHFDPGYRQADIARLIRRGWFERRHEGREREYRWTPEGIAALAPFPAPRGEETV